MRSGTGSNYNISAIVVRVPNEIIYIHCGYIVVSFIFYAREKWKGIIGLPLLFEWI